MHAGSSSQLWLPNRFSGMVAWWDTSIVGNITTVAGNKVTTILDRLGTGNNLVQATDSFRSLSGTRTQNGYNVIDSDGIDDYLTCVGLIVPQPYTLFIVAGNDDGANSTTQTLVDSASTGASRTGKSTTNTWVFNAQNSGTGVSVGTVDTAAHVHTAVGNATSRRRVDGVGAGAAWGTQGLVGIKIGRRWNDTDAWNGWWGEPILFNRELVTAEMHRIEDYYKAKYGTP